MARQPRIHLPGALYHVMLRGNGGRELIHDTLTKDDGSTVDVSKCPEGHGMIKSPMCCARDMTCAV